MIRLAGVGFYNGAQDVTNLIEDVGHFESIQLRSDSRLLLTIGADADAITGPPFKKCPRFGSAVRSQYVDGLTSEIGRAHV